MILKRIIKGILISGLLCSTLMAETIKISATSWIPYTSKDLKSGGFLTEICQVALEKAGYKSKVKFTPWKRAVNMTKTGKSDALIGASYTKERTEYN